MKKKIVREWIALLRKWKKKQGKGKLCQINSGNGKIEYCCLGVLEELHRRYDKSIKKRKSVYYNNILGYYESLNKDVMATTILLEKTAKWAGVDDLQGILYTMNDVQGRSFDEIGDFLEDRLQEQSRARTRKTAKRKPRTPRVSNSQKVARKGISSV